MTDSSTDKKYNDIGCDWLKLVWNKRFAGLATAWQCCPVFALQPFGMRSRLPHDYSWEGAKRHLSISVIKCALLSLNCTDFNGKPTFGDRQRKILPRRFAVALTRTFKGPNVSNRVSTVRCWKSNASLGVFRWSWVPAGKQWPKHPLPRQNGSLLEDIFVTVVPLTLSQILRFR